MFALHFGQKLDVFKMIRLINDLRRNTIYFDKSRKQFIEYLQSVRHVLRISTWLSLSEFKV